MENIKEYAARKKAELKKYLEDSDLHLKTVVIRVGENPASAAYVKGKSNYKKTEFPVIAAK